MLKEFNRNFGISPSIEEERVAFINRITHFLQDFRQLLSNDDYNDLFSTVCVQLGLNPRIIIEENSFLRPEVPELNQLLPYDFFNILKIIIAVRKYFKSKPDMLFAIDENIEGFLNLSAIDLGITYKSGMFFPKGEELLDNDLIEYSLKVLVPFPNENKDIRNALENYRSGSKYGVIENCYRCIEGLARRILNNSKTLIDNKPEIIKSSGLSDYWKKILANYIDYGNEYGRHASEKRHDFNISEVEAYLYMTCVLVRLIVNIKNALNVLAMH